MLGVLVFTIPHLYLYMNATKHSTQNFACCNLPSFRVWNFWATRHLCNIYVFVRPPHVIYLYKHRYARCPRTISINQATQLPENLPFISHYGWPGQEIIAKYRPASALGSKATTNIEKKRSAPVAINACLCNKPLHQLRNTQSDQTNLQASIQTL